MGKVKPLNAGPDRGPHETPIAWKFKKGARNTLREARCRIPLAGGRNEKKIVRRDVLAQAPPRP